jgi:hypothetical protein
MRSGRDAHTEHVGHVADAQFVRGEQRVQDAQASGVDASLALWNHDQPRPSAVGIVLTIVSIAAMQWLARAKRRMAQRLGSRALEADAFQTTACFWLSIITLTGIGLNAAFGWWWADPVAALGMTWFIAREGREAWSGEECGCRSSCTEGADDDLE